MWQIDNLKSNILPRRARVRTLHKANITNLNSRVTIKNFLHDLLKNTLLVQRNKMRHIINQLQVKWFARYTDQDFIIFPTQYSHSRKNSGKSIIYCNIIELQDGDKGATGLGLLYSCKEIPFIILANIYTLLQIINGVATIIYSIIPHFNGKLIHVHKTII